jgi:hypothetical protein
LVAGSMSSGWIIMSQLKGSKIGEISDNHIVLFAGVLKKVFEKRPGVGLMIHAKDPFLKLSGIEREMSRRLHKLDTLIRNFGLSCKCTIQLSQTFESYSLAKLRSDIKASLEFRDYLQNFLGMNTVVSPSDVGFHNSLFDSDTREIYLFDFEYSGLDSPLKAIIDFVFQPEYHLDFHQAEVFFEAMIPDAPISFSEIPDAVLRLYAFKWEMIVAARHLKGQTHNCFTDAVPPLVHEFMPKRSH